MKALSIKQPWANLIASGKKTIETRTWKTNYRGPLLICSSKNPNIYPAGAAIATCDLVDCRRMHSDDAVAALCPYRSELYAWVLERAEKIKPFPVKGCLYLFDVAPPPESGNE